MLGGIRFVTTLTDGTIYAVGGTSRRVGFWHGCPGNEHLRGFRPLHGCGSGGRNSRSSYSRPTWIGSVFDVIVAVVVGGTSLSGGFGAMWRTALGLAILASLENGLNLMGVEPFYKYIVKGCIIVGALGLDVLTRRLAAKAELRARRAKYFARQ